jgi:P-type Ca2+ transporter type 2C
MILGLTLWWSLARDLFRFGQMHVNDLAVTLAVGIAVLAVLEAIKPVWRRHSRLQRLSGSAF